MKKYSIILFIVLSFNACKSNKKTCCSKEKNQETMMAINTDITLHDISHTWTTQDKQKVILKDFNRKVIIMAMIFTNCQSACPRIIADLKRIENQIPTNKLNDIQFLLLTMDPERDTPEQLSYFATTHQLNLKRWTLITGTESDMQDVAGVLNVRIDKLEDGGFDHSNIIHILNNKGNIVHQQIGLATEPTESLKIIDELLENN